ncbi:hypothetical protein EDF35_2248 [Rathayibacter sp. PhB151]|uniref:hypothetical protein n=1 Tax=Rathayibacter sp. PhB151 TaxID=2485189 RepID=UPI0010EBCFE6|nr:hypothetical protein [Rathayibacter sp. PhB151]TDX79023.1 hypothetical protein EDF35_2248 [Rathayibacter sp. PhB151]
MNITVTGVSCSDTGTETERYGEDHYQVQAVIVNDGYSMKATLFADGNIPGFGATTG